mmetsp:Transcript_36341/g.117494  ORF Transcript_36341/g.117494 Transcript_36341/m.117494 type:complete len:251 (+) Transcript_36341:550-1302(+)
MLAWLWSFVCTWLATGPRPTASFNVDRLNLEWKYRCAIVVVLLLFPVLLLTIEGRLLPALLLLRNPPRLEQLYDLTRGTAQEASGSLLRDVQRRLGEAGLCLRQGRCHQQRPGATGHTGHRSVVQGRFSDVVLGIRVGLLRNQQLESARVAGGRRDVKGSLPESPAQHRAVDVEAASPAQAPDLLRRILTGHRGGMSQDGPSGDPRQPRTESCEPAWRCTNQLPDSRLNFFDGRLCILPTRIQQHASGLH